MNEMWRWIELDSGIMGTGSPSLRLLKIKQVVSRRVVHHRRNGIAEPQHAAGNLMLFCDKTFPSSSRPVMPVIVSLQGVVSRRGNSFLSTKKHSGCEDIMPLYLPRLLFQRGVLHRECKEPTIFLWRNRQIFPGQCWFSMNTTGISAYGIWFVSSQQSISRSLTKPKTRLLYAS